MSATANPTATTASAAPNRGPHKAPVRRLNRVPLLITTGLCTAVVTAGIFVAIDRANRRTVEAPKSATVQGTEAIARSMTAGRPDGMIGAKPPAVVASPAIPPVVVAPEGAVQPSISRQVTTTTTTTDPVEEMKKRMALQRAERLEQERQRIELAIIQGHEEALGSPTAIDMARGSYARTADRVRNGMVPGGSAVRSGVVAAAPAVRMPATSAGVAPAAPTVRTTWASGTGGSITLLPGSAFPSVSTPAGGSGAVGDITGSAASAAYGGASGGTRGYAGGQSGVGSPGYVGALQQTQFVQDPNGQTGKLGFLTQQTDAQGYLAHFVQAPLSPYELKKGSVIPATMITGVNSDLPGRMIAQVNQNVYDSATGRYLLLPQGSRLFGRYDAGVTYGQERVLVVWTDLTFPDGSTLHLGSMAGTDGAGYGGFADRVDNHALRTYGSALLLSLVGAGAEYAVATARPPGSVSISLGQAGIENTASTFGSVVRQSFQKNLNIQPTIEIRPGYRFNVIVEKDIVFPPYAR